MHEVTETAYEVTKQFMGLLKKADKRAEEAEASVAALTAELVKVKDEREGYRQHFIAARDVVKQKSDRVAALKTELSMERTSAKTRGQLLDMSIEDGAEKVTEIHDLKKRINDLEANLVMVVDGACALSGPGRGDCAHFVGLPGKSIPGQHDGPDDTVDHRGKPNGWCQRCWDIHTAGKASARVAELDFQLCDGMPARASTNDPVPQDGKRYRVFIRARVVEWESGPNVWVANGVDGAWHANNCDGWMPE